MTRVSWHRVGQPTSSEPFVATVGDVEILLVRAQEKWWGVEDRCTHAGCSFVDDGEIDGIIAICDCHGSEFDMRTGEVLRFPAVAPLRTFPVRETGTGLEIRFD